MAPIGAIWLVCDLDGTNFYTFYGGFKDIGLLEVEAVFHWLYEFGLDVPLGIDGKLLALIPIQLSVLYVFYKFKKS
ncbi:hypothetical protein B0A79_20460 [Flavobacterium piscis]|uniref:Uncharacterized protein n=1 Tax=Flavobacterium piscis TaxID=1114874 RepID=A0ABX2XIM3_9FLAO|nr:hypothetical protein [Flavobacterium piscis]OCB73727.1 hypothetical protein FLP_13705 [Flavobacterium piscis]OXE98548.1 hypothetical protein B0A79_20460 [Flavobacterium piscis]